MRTKILSKIIKDKHYRSLFKSGGVADRLPVPCYTYIFVECHFDLSLFETLQKYYNDSSFVSCTIGAYDIRYRLDKKDYKLYFD